MFICFKVYCKYMLLITKNDFSNNLLILKNGIGFSVTFTHVWNSMGLLEIPLTWDKPVGMFQACRNHQALVRKKIA